MLGHAEFTSSTPSLLMASEQVEHTTSRTGAAAALSEDASKKETTAVCGGDFDGRTALDVSSDSWSLSSYTSSLNSVYALKVSN